MTALAAYQIIEADEQDKCQAYRLFMARLGEHRRWLARQKEKDPGTAPGNCVSATKR